MGMIDKMKTTITEIKSELGSNLGLGQLASGVKEFASNILKGGSLSSFQFEEVEKHFSATIGQIPSGAFQPSVEKALLDLSEPERTSLSTLLDSSTREQNLASYGEENRVDQEHISNENDDRLSSKPDLLASRIARIHKASPQFLSSLASSFLKNKPDAEDTTRVQDMGILQKLLGGIVTAYASSGKTPDHLSNDLRKGA